MKQMLTVGDLAELLRCAPKTIYLMHSRGDLPKAKRIGGMLRWEPFAVERWLKHTGKRRSRRRK